MRTSLSVSTVKRALPATTQASGFATGSISSAPADTAPAAAASNAANKLQTFILSSFEFYDEGPERRNYGIVGDRSLLSGNHVDSVM